MPFSVKITSIASSGSIWTELGAFIAPPLTLLHVKTNRNRGTLCTVPDEPTSCYRTPVTLLVPLVGSLLGLQSPGGSVWGLALGRVGALGPFPMTLLAQPRGFKLAGSGRGRV